MGTMTALLWGAFLLVVNAINPENAGILGFTLFYATLFLALAGLAALIGFYLRFKILKERLVFNLVKIAFRQSFLFAFLIVASLLLLSQKLLSWTNLILLIIILGLAEFIMIGYRPRKI